MGLVTYYFFRNGKGRNAKTPWAIAYNGGEWLRSLYTRGWNDRKEVFSRLATAVEERDLKESMRCVGGRYASLDKLLEDEREILGAESEEYRALETELRKYEGETNMPKAKTEKKKEIINGNGSAAENAILTTQMIPLDKITPSPLPSQERRRKRFDPEKLNELAESIRRHNVVNPITVRETGANKFEIVAGERRFTASQIAGKTEIPAVIRNLSDIDAAEIQLVENGQRQDQHPLDEAFDYLDMKIVLGYTEEEIALRVGKAVKYITNRLKLKDLGQKAREAFEKNQITLSHALEICKYPAEAHEEILSYCFDGFRTEAVFPLPQFIAKIQQHYLLQLKKAPFSVKSAELRADGRACVKCPERTGANPLLFAENYSDKDCCLNRNCWEGKTRMHIRLQRRRIAETDFVVEKAKADYRKKIDEAVTRAAKITDPTDRQVATAKAEHLKAQLGEIEKFGIESPFVQADAEKLEKAVAKVPLITKEWYVRDHEKPAEKYLEREEFRELEKREDCASATRGVFFNGDRIGQSAWICRDKTCKKHFSQSSGTIANPALQGEARLIRKEEIFNSRVAEAVRRRVLRKISERFNANKTIYTHKNAEGYQMEMLARLWQLQCSFSEHTAKVICEVLELEPEQLATSRWGVDFREQILNLSPDVRSRLLFLLLIADKCEIFEAYWSYNSQAGIKELAKDFEVNYRLLDAEERLGQIPMKLKDEFRRYLGEVEAGNMEAKPPVAYSSKFKPKD